MRGTETPLESVRRAVCRTLYADDAVVVSRLPDGLARVMTAVVRVWGAFGQTIREEDGDCRCQFPRIARDGAATNNISTDTGHRNSGPDVRINHEVAILGWAHYRRCRAHTRDQQLEKSRMGARQNVSPGVL